jgi:hypothetical protein
MLARCENGRCFGIRTCQPYPLIAAIETYSDGWNERCQPFVWTKTADQILAKAQRKKTSNTRH